VVRPNTVCRWMRETDLAKYHSENLTDTLTDTLNDTPTSAVSPEVSTSYNGGKNLTDTLTDTLSDIPAAVSGMDINELQGPETKILGYITPPTPPKGGRKTFRKSRRDKSYEPPTGVDWANLRAKRANELIHKKLGREFIGKGEAYVKEAPILEGDPLYQVLAHVTTGVVDETTGFIPVAPLEALIGLFERNAPDAYFLASLKDSRERGGCGVNFFNAAAVEFLKETGFLSGDGGEKPTVPLDAPGCPRTKG